MDVEALLAILDQVDALSKLIRGMLKKPPPPIPDTTPPTDPSSLGVTLVSNVPHLAWTASTDNVVVAGYQIWRKTGSGGTYAQIGVTPGLITYDDHTVSIGNTYFYKVKAFDGAFPPNISGFSNEVSQAIVGADVTAPNVPGQPAAATVNNAVNPPTYTTNFSAVADIDPADGSPVSGTKEYLVYHDGVLQGTVPQTGTVGSPASYTLGAAGAVSGSDSGTVLSASGTGIADPHLDTTDERFLSMAPVQGAGSEVIKLTAFTNTTGSAWPKLGLELRSDLSAGAAYCDLLYFGANGIKGEQRTSAGGHATGGSLVADPGLFLWLKLTWDASWLVTRSYSSNSTNGTDGTWITVDTIQMTFGTVAFVGKFAHPDIVGTGTGTVSATYSNFAVTGASPIVWNGVGVAGTAPSVSAAARDYALNLSARGTGRIVTFSSPVTPTGLYGIWPALALIGGARTGYATTQFRQWASKCGLVLYGWLPGNDFSQGASMAATMADVNSRAAASGRTVAQGSHISATIIRDSANGIDPKFWAMYNANHWMLYTAYSGGSLVFPNGSDYYTNINAGCPTNGAGQTAIQYVVAFWKAYGMDGDQSIITSYNNVPNPYNLFVNIDDQFCTAPVPGDWNRSGSSLDDSPYLVAGTAIRVANVLLSNTIRSVTGLGASGNIGRMTGLDPMSEYVATPYDYGFADQQFGTGGTLEYNNSTATLVSAFSNMAKVVNKLAAFAHFNVRTDGSDALTFDGNGNITSWSPAFQGARHAMCGGAVMSNLGYGASATMENNCNQTPIWWDYMSVNRANRLANTYPNVDAGLSPLGPPVDPPQTTPFYATDKVYRRRFTYGELLWNPRHNGVRTVPFLNPDGSTRTVYRVQGTQNPGYDNGQPVTQWTGQDRDGIMVLYQ